MTPRTHLQQAHEGFTSYALLGSGKVARHFQHYLKQLSLPFVSWSRAEHSRADLHAILESASHVLLAVSDPAIGELAELYLPKITSGQTWVHFSGGTRVPGVAAAHPLMTFGTELRDPAWYRVIPFVVDQGHSFSALLPGLPNPFYEMDPAQRPLYHALCALAGNSVFLLWQRIGQEFSERLALPREVLAPFLHQVVDNALGPHHAGNLTGPVARQDWDMVQKHLEALGGGSLRDSYLQFLRSAKSAGYPIPEVLL